MTCVVTPDGYATDTGVLYDTMSITKGAVGLIFLSTPSTHDILLEPLLPTVDLTIEDALCHYTGVENDDSFDYDTFMNACEVENTYDYAKQIFLREYDNKFKGKQYKYNNIVWRVLVGVFEEISGIQLKNEIRKIPGLQHCDFKSDKSGYMNGMNGLQLDCEMARSYGLWARVQLLKNKEDLLERPAIEPTNWVTKVPGDLYNVHPFYGWFITTLKTNPQKPIAAFSVGFYNQFICVSLNTKDPPVIGVQLKDPYYEDFGGDDVTGFVERWIKENA